MIQRAKASRPGGDLPLPVVRALRKLGQDIRDAHRRRRIPVAVAAERASISKTTWLKVEKGDPGVLAGTYAKVLFVLGLVEKMAQRRRKLLQNAGNAPIPCEAGCALETSVSLEAGGNNPSPNVRSNVR